MFLVYFSKIEYILAKTNFAESKGSRNHCFYEKQKRTMFNKAGGIYQKNLA